jgi:hypothetical protein
MPYDVGQYTERYVQGTVTSSTVRADGGAVGTNEEDTSEEVIRLGFVWIQCEI